MVGNNGTYFVVTKSEVQIPGRSNLTLRCYFYAGSYSALALCSKGGPT